MGVIFVKQDRMTMSAGTAGLHIRSVERSKQARERVWLSNTGIAHWL